MRPISIDTLRRFANAQDAATAIEYALIACGIAGALVVVITAIGGSVSTMYQAIADAFGS